MHARINGLSWAAAEEAQWRFARILSAPSACHLCDGINSSEREGRHDTVRWIVPAIGCRRVNECTGRSSGAGRRFQLGWLRNGPKTMRGLFEQFRFALDRLVFEDPRELLATERARVGRLKYITGHGRPVFYDRC